MRYGSRQRTNVETVNSTILDNFKYQRALLQPDACDANTAVTMFVPECCEYLLCDWTLRHRARGRAVAHRRGSQFCASYGAKVTSSSQVTFRRPPHRTGPDKPSAWASPEPLRSMSSAPALPSQHSGSTMPCHHRLAWHDCAAHRKL